MTRSERIRQAIERLFVEASVHVREERVMLHIENELRKGRNFDEVITDPFVHSALDHDDVHRLLEHPRTVEAIEAEIGREEAAATQEDMPE